jgi:hypothetical protein
MSLCLKNEKGGMGIMMAIIPSVVIFLSFFLINSSIRIGASVARWSMEQREIEDVTAEFAIKMRNALTLAQANPGNCPADTQSVDIGGNEFCMPNNMNEWCTPNPNIPTENYCIDNNTLNAMNSEGNSDALVAIRSSIKPTLSAQMNKWLFKNITRPINNVVVSLAQPLAFVPKAIAQVDNTHDRVPMAAEPPGNATNIRGQNRQCNSNLAECVVCDELTESNSQTVICVQMMICPSGEACGDSGSSPEDYHFQRVALEHGP